MQQQTKSPEDNLANSDKTQSVCPSADECFNAKQAAIYLGKTEVTFHNWKKQGKITPDHYHGKRGYYRFDLLQTYSNAYKGDAPAIEYLDVAEHENHFFPSQSLDYDPPMITSADYETEELHPFKSEAKILDVLIINSSHKPALLLLFLGMLISLMINLLIVIRAEPSMFILAYQLQDEYLQYQTQQQQFTSQGIAITNSRTPPPSTRAFSPKEGDHTYQDDGLHPQAVEEEPQAEQTGKHISLKQIDQPEIGTTSSRLSIWQKAVQSANGIFFTLSRLIGDNRLDDEERDRAKDLIDKILGPYKRLTKYIAQYEPGDVRHDVAMLILSKKPKDFKIDRHRWTVRTLSLVCQKILKSKSASKSSVGRFLKELKWNFAMKPKLLSSDTEYGAIILHLGLIFNRLTDKDLVVFNDDFKFTSSKIAEYLKQKRAAAGLNITLPFGLHKPFFKTKAAIKISGLLTGKSKDLLLKELEDGTFEGYYKTMIELLKELLKTKGIQGQIYLIIDNAPNHQPNIFRHHLLEEFNGQVEVLILPKYAPNHNPIERVWKFLLEATQRCGDTEEELRLYLEKSLDRYNQTKVEADLKLNCQICGKKWVFTDDNREENETSLKKHLCFRVKGLNPYIVYVLTHSLETLRGLEEQLKV